MRKHVVTAAYLLDWLVGDPEALPHPVRLFGKCIAWAEHHLRRPDASSKDEIITGGILAAGLPVAVGLGTAKLLKQIHQSQPLLGCCLEVVLAASCLATRNLLDEASAVLTALEAKDLPAARMRLSRIVGRDTINLDESEISRALIETLAESLSDGVIAPLFYLTLAGVPAALSYKAINTMDSMIGHKDDRYWYFGKAAARLDDAVNFIPARISALLLCVTAVIFPEASGKRSLQSWISDGDKHKSANSGQPESAMAGALSVRLGGTNFYSGEKVDAPLMGEKHRSPTVKDARAAMKMTAIASIFGCTVAFICLWKKSESLRRGGGCQL